MVKFTITNPDNTKLSVDLVRYFKFMNDCYLIYTLNEVDEKGYLKLYLVKVMEELGFPVTHNIKDDKEWQGMQNVVKKVLKEIKNKKRKLLEDLDYHDIEAVKITEPRFFKLDKKLADILSSDYMLNQVTSQFDNLNETADASFVSLNNEDNSNMNVEVSSNQTNNEYLDPVQTENNSLSAISENIILEPMETTLKKQGAFGPIPVQQISNTFELQNAQDIEQGINSVTVENDNNIIKSENILNETNSIENDVNELTNKTQEFINNEIQQGFVESVGETPQNSNNDENIISSVKNHSEFDLVPIDGSIVVDEKNIENNQIADNFEANSNANTKNKIDYKKLYLAEKEEREATNQLLDDLLEELMNYRLKYGELEK